VVTGTTTPAGGLSDDQLLRFVRTNGNLRFGLIINLPAGIPATGGNGQGTTGSGTTTGTGTTNGPTSLAGMSGKAASDAACSTGAPKGFGYYKVRSGDTLESIAQKFGISVSRILELNAGSAFAKGNILLLPGVEAPGAWNVKEYCQSSGTSNNNTGGGVVTLTPVTTMAPTGAATVGATASPMASPAVTATP
jgi:LysM repeat protein